MILLTFCFKIIILKITLIDNSQLNKGEIMNKPKIFYEDNKIGKKRLTILIVVLSICFIGWTLAMILSFVVPMPDGVPQNKFEDNLADNIAIIVLLVLLLAAIIALLIFRFKTHRFDYAISITEDEIQFAVPVENKKEFKTKEFVSYEILDKLNSFARVKLVFTDGIETTIKTRKFDELKIALEYIQAQNQTHQSLNDNK